MRITIHIPDAMGEDLKRTAANQGLSTSHIVAKAVEDFLIRQQKKSLGEKVLELAAKACVSPDALDTLEEGRVDNRS